MKLNPIIVEDSSEATVNAIAERLDQDGCVVLRIPELQAALEATKSELEQPFQAFPNSEGLFYGSKTRRFGAVFAKSKAAQKLACAPSIVDVMQNLLGRCCDCIQLNLTQAISIHPGEREQLPHRDDEAFPIPHEGHHFMINAMWALTDFTKENGATRIWPGSHKDTLTREPDYNDVVYAEMEKGDVLLYVGALLHHGGSNTTDTPRDGLVISYSLGWLRQAENQFLSYSRDEVMSFSPELQELIGYRPHRPNLGWVHGDDPAHLLRSQAPSPIRPTKDLLPEGSEELINEYLAQVSSAA